MRRNVVAKIAFIFRYDGLELLMQELDLLLHSVELFLLAEDAAVEFIDAGIRGVGFHAGDSG